MQWLRDFIVDVLEPVDIVIGIILAVPIFWTWWAVTFGRRWQYRRWFKEIARKPGSRPAILIVDLLEQKEIAASVHRYRQSSDQLKDIPDDRIFTVSREKRLRPDDIVDLVREIRNVAANVIRAGIDTVHLFYAGPVIPPAIIGAEFANTCRVILYQHTQEGYESWGPLRHDF